MIGSAVFDGAQPLPEGERQAVSPPLKAHRFISGNELPNSIYVYLTNKDGKYFILHTDSLWLGEWNFADSWITMTALYRHAREKLDKKPVTFHVPTLEMALDLVDALPNEIKYGRLAVMQVVQEGSTPTPPPNPDQALIDWMAAFEAGLPLPAK